MSPDFLEIASFFFFVLHTFVIFINLFGWVFWKFRRFHYCILGTTLFSWLALGYFYGWGYCFLTDWHYEILRKLDYRDLPHSYIKFCLDSLLGMDADPFWVDVGTAGGLLFGLAGAGFNLWKSKKLSSSG